MARFRIHDLRVDVEDLEFDLPEGSTIQNIARFNDKYLQVIALEPLDEQA